MTTVVLNIRPDFIATEIVDSDGKKWVEYRNYKNEVCATYSLDLQWLRSAVVMPPPIPDGYEPPPNPEPIPIPEPTPIPTPPPVVRPYKSLISGLNVRIEPD